MFSCLLCLPGQQHLHDFPELLTSSSYSDFIVQPTAFRSSGPWQRRLLSGDVPMSLSVPSWPWEPHCWLPEQQAARGCQHSCSLFPGDPLLLGLPSEHLAYTVNQDPIFHNIFSPPALKINKINK